MWRGKEGLEGEDFPGKFRETPRPPDPTRTSFAKSHWRGAKVRPYTGPPSPLLTPICVDLALFSLLFTYFKWGENYVKVIANKLVFLCNVFSIFCNVYILAIYRVYFFLLFLNIRYYIKIYEYYFLSLWFVFLCILTGLGVSKRVDRM